MIYSVFFHSSDHFSLLQSASSFFPIMSCPLLSSPFLSSCLNSLLSSQFLSCLLLFLLLSSQFVSFLLFLSSLLSFPQPYFFTPFSSLSLYFLSFQFFLIAYIFLCYFFGLVFPVNNPCDFFHSHYQRSIHLPNTLTDFLQSSSKPENIH